MPARGSGAGLPPRVPGSQKAEPLTVRCDGGMARGICDIPVGVPVRLRADPVLPVVELPDEELQDKFQEIARNGQQFDITKKVYGSHDYK